MKHYAVFGTQFGDEGKGLATDFFAQKLLKTHGRTTVQRFASSSQAGHTVVDPNGRRHVHHHVPSGMMDSQIRGELGRKFIINPCMLLKEHEELKHKHGVDISYRLSYCPDSIVALPHDVIVNQLLERSRGSKAHGSVGQGVYETVLRSKSPWYVIKMKDAPSRIRNVLKRIQRFYFPMRLKDAGLSEDMARDHDLYKVINDPHFIDIILDQMKRIKKIMPCQNGTPDPKSCMVYEGAQGLLLDEKYGMAPHLTPCPCGMEGVPYKGRHENLEDLISPVYVTRWYQTRHGHGPMNHPEDRPSPKIVDHTNIPHDFQGTLRFGLIDINEFHRLIKLDCFCVTRSPSIFISCLDQVENGKIPCYLDGCRKTLSVEEFLSRMRRVENRFPIKLYASFGPTRNDVHEFSD